MDEDANRLYLQEQLETAFPDVEGIWYRPPGSVFLERPCIIYLLLQHEPSYSNNLTYVLGTRFQVTILSDLPGIGSKKPIFNIPNVSVINNNAYVTNDVVHDVFTVIVNTI